MGNILSSLLPQKLQELDSYVNVFVLHVSHTFLNFLTLLKVHFILVQYPLSVLEDLLHFIDSALLLVSPFLPEFPLFLPDGVLELLLEVLSADILGVEHGHQFNLPGLVVEHDPDLFLFSASLLVIGGLFLECWSEVLVLRHF